MPHPYLPRGPLLVSVLAQNLGGVAIQGDDACSAFSLWCAAFSRPAQLHDLLADGDGAPGKVDIGPGKADCLVSAQAPKRHQVEERIEPVLPRVVEQAASLGRRLDGDLGPLPRRAPRRDPLVGTATAPSLATC